MTTDLATVDLRQTDEPIQAPAWKNLVFAKNDRSYLCTNTHDSEQQAQRMAEKGIASDTECIMVVDGPVRAEITYGGIRSGRFGRALMKSDVARIVQIPWNGGPT